MFHKLIPFTGQRDDLWPPDSPCTGHLVLKAQTSKMFHFYGPWKQLQEEIFNKWQPYSPRTKNARVDFGDCAAAPWWPPFSCSSDMSGASNTLAREFLTDVHQLCSAVAQRAEARDEDEEESHMVALGEYLVRGRGFLLLSTLDSIIDQVWVPVLMMMMRMMHVKTINTKWLRFFSYLSLSCEWYDLPVGEAAFQTLLMFRHSIHSFSPLVSSAYLFVSCCGLHKRKWDRQAMCVVFYTLLHSASAINTWTSNTFTT